MLGLPEHGVDNCHDGVDDGDGGVWVLGVGTGGLWVKLVMDVAEEILSGWGTFTKQAL